jgi:hypothetical protein
MQSKRKTRARSCRILWAVVRSFDFDFYPKSIGILLMSFKQRSKIIRMCNRKRITEDQQESWRP